MCARGPLHCPLENCMVKSSYYLDKHVFLYDSSTGESLSVIVKINQILVQGLEILWNISLVHIYFIYNIIFF